MKVGNAGGGKGPQFWDALEGTKDKEIGVSLKTPEKTRQFQRKLYVKGKADSTAHGRAADSQHMNPVGEPDAGKPHARPGRKP